MDRNAFGPGFPSNGLFIRADVATPASIAAVRKKVVAFTSHLDALVNNAAVQVAKPLMETSVEEWDNVMDNNLRPAFLLAKLSHPLFKSGGGGAIVNVSSVHAVATSAGVAAYAASKGGLLALSRAMAI